MNVLNVNFILDLKSGGGTAERTFQMSRFLARQGMDCTVLTLDIGLTRSRVALLEPARVVALPCLWKRFFVPLMGWKTIIQLVKDADVIHLMGHWSALNVLVYFATRVYRKPYVVCPAGALPLFGRSVWLKRIFNFIVGNAIVRNASAWIAVTTGEYPQYDRYGIHASQVTVIPNGVFEDDLPETNIKEFLNRHSLPDVPTILFMGRLNPIKGPDLLLKAFIQVRDRLPGYNLIFAGPDDGMLSELRKVTEQNGIADRVRFLGHVDGVDKSGAYRFARLLVIPSRQEAMSIVALEAGICGTPVLLTDQCGFGDVRSIDPRLEVPATAEGLAAGLINLLAKPDELQDLAPVWKNYVHKRYTWPTIGARYIQLYESILELR
jgi:glycosyltransferase involved in cell wall biosynthesis